MKSKHAMRSATVLLLVALGADTALAAEATGVWLRDTGTARVRIAPCGDALCGNIVWLRDKGGPAKLGQRVFFDMKPQGPGRWSGSAFNPEDGKTYSGTMSVSGNSLTTSGCVLGGLICQSANWSRYK